MRPRLKAQNQVKCANRSRLDRDLMILQRALKKIADWREDEDWRRELKCEHLFVNGACHQTHRIEGIFALLVMLCF